LRVGYELTGLELDAAGSARYITSLRRELEQLEGIELVPLRHEGAARAGTAGRIVRGLRRELAYFPVQLPWRARRLRLDVLHCPAPLAPVRSTVPTVVTVHDILGLDHPEWFTRALALHSQLVLAPVLRRAASRRACGSRRSEWMRSSRQAIRRLTFVSGSGSSAHSS
jgi:hypothetical protein